MINELKFLVSPNPSYIIFWVTGACNLRCSHCFNSAYQETCGRDLSLGEIRAICRNMKHVKYLTLAGGEPLLRSDLADISRMFYRYNDLHMLNLVTNGWYTDRAVAFAEEVLDACPDLHLSVGVSLDGPEDIHDRLRGRAGSYDRAVETLTRLKLLSGQTGRLTVAASGTCHSGNVRILPDFARLLRDSLGVPYYAGLIRGENLPDMGLTEVDPDIYKAVFHAIGTDHGALAPEYPFRHIRLAVDEVVGDIIHASSKHHRATVRCTAGKKGFVLTSDGHILLCEILNTRLGNVRDFGYDPYRILKRPKAKDALDHIRKTGCHCTWECFQRLNVVFSPAMLPRVALKSLKHWLK